MDIKSKKIGNVDEGHVSVMTIQGFGRGLLDDEVLMVDIVKEYLNLFVLIILLAATTKHMKDSVKFGDKRGVLHCAFTTILQIFECCLSQSFLTVIVARAFK